MRRAESSAPFLPAPLALPLALAFGALAALRRHLYRTGRLRTETLPVPVVVVGNIAVGGTGKTPLVMALVEAARAHGRTPGVVSRGYGGSAGQGGPAQVVDSDEAARWGDEVVLMRRRTGVPVAVARDRVAAGRALLAVHPEVDLVIADDGLQHYRLARDCEIAVLDPRGVGNGRLLPAGILREPASRLESVDVIVTHGAPASAWPAAVPRFGMRLETGEVYALADPTRTRPLEALRGTRILGAAGIGVPERFFAGLRAAGLDLATLPLPDHFDFRVNPFVERSEPGILITEKDAVKCDPGMDARIWVVPVRAVLDPGLIDCVLRIADAKARSRSSPA